MNPKKNTHTPVRHLTRLALYTALALVLYWVESLLPPLVPIPGVKLGLANLITLLVLHSHSGKDALTVLLMRILLSSFAFGQALSLLYSLSGGILCFLTMLLINRLLQGHFLYLTSICGAIAHNIGQLLIAYLITKVSGVLVYLPFLTVSAVLTGLFIGLCAHFSGKYLTPRIRRFFPD